MSSEVEMTMTFSCPLFIIPYRHARLLTEQIKTYGKMKKELILTALSLSLAVFAGCMKEEKRPDNGFEVKPSEGSGLFIACQGNFSYGNATLAFYDINEKKVENELFAKANGSKLGDTAQSMTIYDGTLWIVVNNSNVIYAIDPYTFKIKGRIEGVASPRYIHFVSDDKAYVTQMEDGDIAIVNPKTFKVTGSIDTGENVFSTEQIADFGDYIITNCWSFQKSILKIDTRTDKVIGSLEVGEQPSDIVKDRNGKLWVATDGGWTADWSAKLEDPTIKRINPETLTVEETFTFSDGTNTSKLTTDKDGGNLYWLINGGVWKMPVDATALPQNPVIGNLGYSIYALGVCPFNGDIYVGDAIDYTQNGKVSRYTADFKLADEFEVGITPGAFCWY